MPYFLGSIWQRIILFHTQTRINQIEIFQTNDKSSRYRENGYMCSRVALKRQLIVIASWMRQIFGDAVFLTHFPLISTHIFKQNSKIVFLLQKPLNISMHERTTLNKQLFIGKQVSTYHLLIHRTDKTFGLFQKSNS